MGVMRAAAVIPLVLGALMLLSPGSGAVGTADAAALPGPVILGITASSPQDFPLPAAGAPVVVTVTVRNARTCTFLSQHLPFSALYPVRTVACASGSVSVTAPRIPNPYKRAVTLTYAVRVYGSGQSFVQNTITVTEAAAPSQPPPPAPTPTPLPAPTAPTGVQLSPNWSGYVVPSSSLITEASGVWTVPALNCSATPTGGASTWVGIGGFSWPTGGTSGGLLQTGVTTNCVNGVQQDLGWWEEVPSIPNYARNFSGFTVYPGNVIRASVFEGSSGAWETRVDDLTTGLSGVMVTGQGWGVLADAGNGTFLKQGSTAGLSYSGGYTAEWIVEDYSENGGMVPFASYGTVTFTQLTTSLASWYLAPSDAVAMAQNGVLLSTPSAPSGGGFSVSYVG